MRGPLLGEAVWSTTSMWVAVAGWLWVAAVLSAKGELGRTVIFSVQINSPTQVLKAQCHG